MYKNRKGKKANNNGAGGSGDGGSRKRQLNTIDENATIKITRPNEPEEKENQINDVFGSEDENVPLSQEPTQRYLSQRSIICSTLARTQSSNATYRPPRSYFEWALMKADVQMDEGDTFVMDSDHITFVGKLRDNLAKCQTYPENIAQFKNGLSEALGSNSKYVQKLLTGCTISAAGEDIVYQSQDSMIVNFFMIDFLRDQVLDVLLDKITEIACKERVTYLANSNIGLLPLLLTQLRSVVLSHGERIYEHIRNVFEQCQGTWAKMDIIANAEFVIEARRHDEFVQMLLNNFASSKELFQPTIVQALTSLQLSANMQNKLRAKALAYVKDNECPYETLPVLVQFLLQMLNEKNDELLVELVATLREILICHTTARGAEKAEDRNEIQLEIFRSIGQRLTCSKKFYTFWQKKIASLSATQFRCVDFLMILVLISIKEDNYMYISNILRRRIKKDEIQIDILTECKTKYVAIVELHTNTLMLVLHDFLKEKSKAVNDFARASYGILFQICETLQKNILRKLLELIFDKSTQNLTNLALELLRDLQCKHPSIIQHWGTILLPLLDRLNEMSLGQTRLVMQILCSIAYPVTILEDCPQLQDQIDMIVKKQIINKADFVKKQGIIGQVQLINAIAQVEKPAAGDNSEDPNLTFNTVSDLPEGRGKVAANYFVRIYSSTKHCPELLALLYDELASVFGASLNESENGTYHDRPFLIWLCELVTYYFQNNFVAEHTPQTISGIELAYQKCINSIEDAGDTESELPVIAVNIGELVLKPSADATSSVLVLAPLFHLVCVIHLKCQNGSLEQVNALLGCAIILPTFFDNPKAEAHIFSDYDESLQRKILDIYFHCANWIRETISSFSTQREALIRKKVLQRLGDLISIECNVRSLLSAAPADYVPPMCQFSANATSPSGGKSTGRGRPTADTGAGPSRQRKANLSKTTKFNETETEDALPMTGNATHVGNVTMRAAKGKGPHSGVSTKFQCSYGPKETYRAMGSEIMLILKENFRLSCPLAAEDVGEYIGLREFHFLLMDIVSKLESLTGVCKLPSAETLQYIAKPDYFMSDLSQFLTTISVNLQKIHGEFQTRLKSVDNNYGHTQLFSEEVCYLKACFGLCIRLVADFFSWSHFNDASGNKEELLKASLASILADTKSQQKRRMNMEISMLATELLKTFFAYEKSTAVLKTAVYLVQCSETMKRFTLAGSLDDDTNKPLSVEIRALCKTFLCRRWYTSEGILDKGAECNIYLNELVKGFLKDSDFKRLQTIIVTLLDESKQLGRKDSSLASFPNFKKANFPILFRGLCETLVDESHRCITSMDDRVTNGNDKLKLWEKSCRLMNMLLDIVQAINIPRNFQSFLKYSHMYLKLMLQHGLAVLEECIRPYAERVGELLKDMQVTTRFLHNLCCHSKALKNTTIVSQIPMLRETVETFVFRVKALMAANKCASVFSMANLKNKDLHGDVLLSQTADAEDENSDEDIPEDDENLEETFMDPHEASTSVSSAVTSRESAVSKSSSRSKCF